MGHRNILIHFANRELNKTTSFQINSKKHAELTRLAATMTSGCLCAPFSQVHEQYTNLKDINNLVGALCAMGKMRLYNGSRDTYQFLGTRAELYYGVKEKYPFYFGRKKLVHEQDYTRLSGVSSTDEIKKVLRESISGKHASNILSMDEVGRISRHQDFIKRTLDSEKIGATFSVYEEFNIEPKPAEEIFLGEISSRIYTRYQAGVSDSIVMTGIYNDEYIEDYDQYPVYDVDVHRDLMHLLGWGDVVDDLRDTTTLCSLVGDLNFGAFSELRAMFLRALIPTLKREYAKKTVPAYSIKTALQDIARALPPAPGKQNLSNAAAIYARMTCMVKCAEWRFPTFKEEMDILRVRNMDKCARIVAIHVATDLEEEVAREMLAVYGWAHAGIGSGGRISYNRYVKSLYHDIILFRTAAGSGGAGGSTLVASGLLEQLKPTKVISTGICFGTVPGKQTLGDVIVSTRVAQYELSRVSMGQPDEFRGDKQSTDGEVVSRAYALRAEPRPYAIHIGHTLSGDKLIDSTDFRDKLLSFDPKAIGGDMEAAGLSAVCGQQNVGFSMIKGIADFAESKSKDSQRLAAENALKLTLDIVAGGFSTH